MRARWMTAAGALALFLAMGGTVVAGETKGKAQAQGAEVETQAGRQDQALEKRSKSGEKSLQSLSCPKATLLQAGLKRQGLYEGELTGRIDDRTRNAFHEYQRMLGVEKSNRIDERTASLLHVETQEIQPVRGLDYTDDPAVIRSIQKGLAERGLYEGEVDGRVSPDMRSAVRKFQEMHGLEPTGLLTQYTVWRLLPPEAEAPSKKGSVTD